MNAHSTSPNQQRSEHLLARLTDAAYRVALKHGIRGAFLQVELELWSALREVLEPLPPTGLTVRGDVSPIAALTLC
jgi:hypothetical protein